MNRAKSMASLLWAICCAGVAWASELDTKHTINETTVLIHSMKLPSYTQPLLGSSKLPGDEEDKKSSALAEAETKVAQDPIDGFTEALFPGMRSSQAIALAAASALEEKMKEYKGLYRNMLKNLLPYFPQVEPPRHFARLKPVGDERSYTIDLAWYHTEERHGFDLRSRLTGKPTESYVLNIPFSRPDESNLSLIAPRSTEEAYGWLTGALSPFLSYNNEKLAMVQDRLRRYRNGLVFASFIGTTAYWMVHDGEHGASAREKAGDFFSNVGIHVGSVLLLEYPIEIVSACKKRKNQKSEDALVIRSTPVVADVEPLVLSLVRKHACNALHTAIDNIQYERNPYAWLCCCMPLIIWAKRALSIPLRDLPETERIHELLQGSQEKLREKLEGDGIQNANVIAAQRVQSKYQHELARLYELNPDNVTQIFAKSDISTFDFTPRRRAYLVATMRRARKDLEGCFPQSIEELAQTQLPSSGV